MIQHEHGEWARNSETTVQSTNVCVLLITHGEVKSQSNLHLPSWSTPLTLSFTPAEAIMLSQAGPTVQTGDMATQHAPKYYLLLNFRNLKEKTMISKT